MKITTRQIVVTGLLVGIIVMLKITGLGSIPFPTLAGVVTIMHVPVILGGILEGPLVGAAVGLIFGLFSFLAPASAMAADPLVAILPRIFIGVTAYYAFRLLQQKTIGIILAAVVGTLTNTIGFLGMAALLGYLPLKAAVGIAVLHGIPEILVATVITVLVVPGIRKATKRQSKLGAGSSVLGGKDKI